MAHASDCNKPTHRPRVARVYALALLLALTLFVHFSGQLMADDAALVEVFARSGVEGTTVISSLSGEQTFIYNEPRAHQRFSPASTFKIPNTLISLEEQAIAGEDAVFEWDGQIYEIPNWNHDQTLESAFKVSCVWCFQQLAIQVGGQRFRAYLHELDYGELSEPFSETTFWLDGSLTISATEQVEFLKKLYRRSLPFSASAYETLRAIMLVETTADYSIWAKDGVGDARDTESWLVRWLYRDADGSMVLCNEHRGRGRIRSTTTSTTDAGGVAGGWGP